MIKVIAARIVFVWDVVIVASIAVHRMAAAKNHFNRCHLRANVARDALIRAKMTYAVAALRPKKLLSMD